ncbi:uncharacterized protein LOC117303700 [Asterias rubens]|uniref:uncharacterized protein LOC117303700 n=1 Tax=Asterias rubens TaxID=7604 RepID=UPI001454F013|nr:uncharacterized protein LOC117303700 [Asterias rubens]
MTLILLFCTMLLVLLPTSSGGLLDDHAGQACTLKELPQYMFAHGHQPINITCVCTRKNMSEDAFVYWKTNLNATIYQEHNETTITSTLCITPHLQGNDRLEWKVYCEAEDPQSLTMTTMTTMTTLAVCPTEQLECDPLQQSPTALNTFNVSCWYKTKCGTALRCEVGNVTLEDSLSVGNNTYVYRNVNLDEEYVKCYLHHSDMDKGQRTEVNLLIPQPHHNSITTAKPAQPTSVLPTTQLPPINSKSNELGIGIGLGIIIGIVITIVTLVVTFVLLMKKSAKFREFMNRLGPQTTADQTQDLNLTVQGSVQGTPAERNGLI